MSKEWSASDEIYEKHKASGTTADIPHDQLALHCWNCGGVGHMKEDCPDPPSGLTKGQIRRRRKFANRRPAASIDTLAIVQAPHPFNAWAEALFAGIYSESIRMSTAIYP